MLPTDITIDSDNNIHTASFDYYSGIKVAKERNLVQTTSFKDVFNSTHFIVCCGDVMFRVKPEEYPEVERRTI